MYYTIYASDLNQRMKLHQEGKVTSAQNRRPLKLIYLEGYIHQNDATRK